MANAHGDLGELTFETETEMVDVTSALPRPDQDWRFTDQHGHEHYWRDGYPTLVWVPDGEPYWDDDLGEDYQPTRLECPQCHEAITPTSRVDTSRRYVAGRTSYKLNGQSISEERARQIMADGR